MVVVVVAGAARHLEQEREKGELQKVGVLVLVDQEVAVPLLQRRAHRRERQQLDGQQVEVAHVDEPRAPQRL